MPTSITATLATAALIASVAGFLAERGVAQQATAPDGHRLALRLCGPCHVVASDQEAPPILREPAETFVSIANRKGITSDWLRVFLRSTHGTTTPPFRMPNPELADYQAEAIITFLLSLRMDQPAGR